MTGPVEQSSSWEKRDGDIYGKYICWCQTFGFIVRREKKKRHKTQPPKLTLS